MCACFLLRINSSSHTEIIIEWTFKGHASFECHVICLCAACTLPRVYVRWDLALNDNVPVRVRVNVNFRVLFLSPSTSWHDPNCYKVYVIKHQELITLYEQYYIFTWIIILREYIELTVKLYNSTTVNLCLVLITHYHCWYRKGPEKQRDYTSLPRTWPVWLLIGSPGLHISFSSPVWCSMR